jgi:FixJ family two-component response regulator
MKNPLVFVVDDDQGVRKSLERLLRSHGFTAELFGSAQEFLKSNSCKHQGPCCLVLDVRMPGLSGIDLHQEFIAKDISLPVIFITGHGDIPMGVKAMKRGAVDFLPKPFDERDLLAAIDRAIDRDIQVKKAKGQALRITRLYNTLTPQEQVVLTWVITGMLNKQIGRELGITEKTVKVHRGRVMQKMEARSVAELVRMCQKASIKAAKK